MGFAVLLREHPEIRAFSKVLGDEKGQVLHWTSLRDGSVLGKDPDVVLQLLCNAGCPDNPRVGHAGGVAQSLQPS